MVTQTAVSACGYAVSPGRERERKGKREGTHADDGVEDGSDGRDDGHDAAADGCARVQEWSQSFYRKKEADGARGRDEPAKMDAICLWARESLFCVPPPVAV
jgi:hypothetical protein